MLMLGRFSNKGPETQKEQNKNKKNKKSIIGGIT